MKLTVLVDNNTYIDQYYLGEPAVSYYIEDSGTNLLFDVGYSDIYVSNAEKMGVRLHALDSVILSHGHVDHTGGLPFFPDIGKKCKLIGHTQVLEKKWIDDLFIGSPLDARALEQRFDLQLRNGPVQVSENLLFLGEIERTIPFENKVPIGMRQQNGSWVDDYLPDDSALVYRDPKGLVIITGCSHAGICNIIEYAKKVTGDDRVHAVIGGFHLFDAESEQAKKTIEYLKQYRKTAMYPCHCTSFTVRAALAAEVQVIEVGVGLTITW